MSKFTSKFRQNKPSNVNGLEKVKSFNDETTLNEETEYLIVGTLTPPDGRGVCKNDTFPGYFYCSKKNDMYSFIDNAFPNSDTKLVDLKKQFRDSKWSIDIKEEIIKELKSRHIAFLDVVKEAYVKKGSASDNDIVFYQLDKESFKNLNKNLKIVANSNNAYVMLKDILKENGVDQETINKIEMIPQSLMGYWKIYPNKESLIKRWNNFFIKEK